MNYDNYVLHLQGAIKTYPSKVKKHLLKLLVDNGVAQAQEQMSLDYEERVDVIDLELEEQLIKCLKESKSAVKLFEEWEFTKDYKYSTFFTTESFSDIVSKASSKGTLLQSDDCEDSFIAESVSNPTRYEVDDLIILKFCIKYSAIYNLSGEEVLTKYPVIIALHKAEELIEFRFDALKRLFLSEKRERTIYQETIKDLKAYCENNLECSIEPLDLDYIVSETKDKTDVRQMAQYMKLPSGGSAQLDVGKNEEYVLPIIGELKEIIRDHVVELERIPVLKEALNQFIFENEELSDYSWIELMWENEIKTRNIRVKFIFNYMNNEYCLLQHYHSHVLIGMERMNIVVKYIRSIRPLKRD